MTSMLEAYAVITGADVIQHLQQLAKSLKGKTVVHTRQLREHLTLMVSLQHGVIDRIDLS